MSDVSAATARFLASLPPTIPFRPPGNMRENYSSKQVVYCVPLSTEWLDTRYERDAPLNPDPDNESGVISRFYYFEQLLFDMMYDCRELVSFNCYPALVKTANHGRCIVMVIGRPWARPTPEQVKEVRFRLMREYLVVDVPGWFPLA